MPHVDTLLRAARPAPCVRVRSTFADPALWAWLVVGLMLIAPLRALVAG
jgi:hypothetical protein